jgi:hypothetical protein
VLVSLSSLAVETGHAQCQASRPPVPVMRLDIRDRAEKPFQIPNELTISLPFREPQRAEQEREMAKIMLPRPFPEPFGAHGMLIALPVSLALWAVILGAIIR